MNQKEQDIPIVTASLIPDGGGMMAMPQVLPPPSLATSQSVPVVVPGRRATLTKGRSERVMLPKQKSYAIRESEVDALSQQGFTRGLAETLTRNNAIFPLRIWVVDNSGSMVMGDGNRMVETLDRSVVRMVTCTRWAEIQQTVEYHAQMAALIRAPTVFRLLNDPGRIIGPQQFAIHQTGLTGEGQMDSDVNHQLAVALQTMKNASPGGCTPLAVHLREIRSNLLEMEPTLRQNGTKVAVILATDGLPTNRMGRCNSETKAEFVQSLKALEGLPVWMVIRLCTDEDDVVQFYNDLDAQLELSLEVLDDFVQEAREVAQHNSWLNYGLPLHRMREMGYHNRLFDLLDERKLTAGEMHDFCRLLYGQDAFDGVADPQADWKNFSDHLERIQRQGGPSSANMQWNPVTQKVGPWIDMKKLDRSYNPKAGGCTIM